MDIIEAETAEILSFLNYLRTEYIPRRIAGDNTRKLAPKNVYNIYVSLASFSRGQFVNSTCPAQ